MKMRVRIKKNEKTPSFSDLSLCGRRSITRIISEEGVYVKAVIHRVLNKLYTIRKVAAFPRKRERG